MYQIEINCRNPSTGKYTWKPMQPTHGSAYTFESRKAARRTLDMCYPVDQTKTRIVKK